MLARTEPHTVGMSADRLHRIDGWMQGYVDADKLPGCLTAVMRRGRIAYLNCTGMADPQSNRPVTEDTVFRIYSMTKPIVTAAAMTFFEEGRFQLDDPISRFLPEFADTQAHVSGAGEALKTEPVEGGIKFWQVMSHTAGFVYADRTDSPVSKLYKDAGISFQKRNEGNLADMVSRLATVPLRGQPGARWEYSVATDVLGRLVEVLGGKPLNEVLKERIFDPLGMAETAFQVRSDQLPRYAAQFDYKDGGYVQSDPADATSSFAKPVTLFSGGGGLVSTVGDYLRFAEAIRRKGELNGARILGRRTVELMTMNHLPGNVDLTAMGQPVFSETPYDGIGFGLGFSVVIDVAAAKAACSVGEHAWGGAASTAFWIDPVEDISVVFMTQLMPSSTYPIRRELRSLVYQSLVE